MSRVFIWFSFFGVVGFLILVGSFFYLNRPADPQSTDEVIFEVKPGSFQATAKDLEAEGLVRSQWQLKILARLKNQASSVRVGEYSLAKNMTPSHILNIITSGKSILRNVTIPEGSNIFEVANYLESAGIGPKENVISICFDKTFLRNAIDWPVESCEGYLFPETYAFTKYTTPKELLSQMVDAFKVQFRKVEDKAQSFGLTKHQLVTLASIIEKETGADSERRKVSSVYHNRLRKKMRMQADPTTLYGKMIENMRIENNITRADLTRVNSYNTYAMSGLPKGPIANPGLDSLLAAIDPETTEYLFFVSRNDGTHIFSKDYKAHKAAVTIHQMDVRARQGKSWRDLKKTKRKETAR